MVGVGTDELALNFTGHRVSLENYNDGIVTLRDRSRNPIRVVVENNPGL